MTPQSRLLRSPRVPVPPWPYTPPSRYIPPNPRTRSPPMGRRVEKTGTSSLKEMTPRSFTLCRIRLERSRFVPHSSCLKPTMSSAEAPGEGHLRSVLRVIRVGLGTMPQSPLCPVTHTLTHPHAHRNPGSRGGGPGREVVSGRYRGRRTTHSLRIHVSTSRP